MTTDAWNRDTVGACMRTLAEKTFHTTVHSVRYIGGGSYGKVYRAELDAEPYAAVLKAYRVSGMHKTEQAQIALLSEHSLIRYPKVYAAHDENADSPFCALAMEYIDGVNAFNPRFMLKSAALKKRFGECIAKNEVHMHQVKGKAFGPLLNPSYDSWNAFYFAFAREVLDNARLFAREGKLNPQHVRTLQRAYDVFDRIFEQPVEMPVLLHGDLNVANILVDPKTLDPKAIIDPCNSLWGDPEYGLFQFHNFFNKTYGILDHYKARVSVSALCDVKIAVYAFFNEIHCYMTSGVKIEPFNLWFNRALTKELNAFLRVGRTPTDA